MVVEYLEKKYENLFEEKVIMEREIQKKRVQYNDSMKFVHTLEKSLDENFESFSPRKVDEENHNKINQLYREQKKIEGELEDIAKKIEQKEIELRELNEVLNAARHMVYENEKQSQEQTTNIDLKTFLHKIDACCKFIDVDPNRCKLELLALDKLGKELLKNL